MTEVIDGLYYTATHEWARILDNGRARLGVTDYAQREMSDVVFFSPPEVGDDLAVGDAIGDLESIKAVSTVYTPLAGCVTAINDDVAQDPGLINRAPYEAWLVELEGDFDVSALLDADAYRVSLAS